MTDCSEDIIDNLKSIFIKNNLIKISDNINNEEGINFEFDEDIRNEEISEENNKVKNNGDENDQIQEDISVKEIKRKKRIIFL